MWVREEVRKILFFRSACYQYPLSYFAAFAGIDFVIFLRGWGVCWAATISDLWHVCCCSMGAFRWLFHLGSSVVVKDFVAVANIFQSKFFSKRTIHYKWMVFAVGIIEGQCSSDIYLYILLHRKFVDGSNAVTPRPSWPANGDIRKSKKTPLSETHWEAMNFGLWKQIGQEFMVKSNINHWIVCKEGTGSLVQYRAGSLDCRVVKNIAPTCHNVAPDEIRMLTKESSANFGPHLYNSKSSTFLKTYYYWESSTQSPNWPTHDPCGQNGLSHVKNVVNPHGNIFIR